MFAKHREHLSESHSSFKGKMTLFACLKCPEETTRSFPSRSELRRHENRVHSTELSCGTGEKDKDRTVTFETFSLWKSHLDYHRGRKPYLCMTCWRAFGQKLDLENHVAAVHDKVGKFQCSICRDVFVQRVQVDRHIVKFHVHQKLFRHCQPCSQMFSTEKKLCAHLRTRHNWRGGRICCCKYCEAWFLQKSVLTDHISQLHLKKYGKLNFLQTRFTRTCEIFRLAGGGGLGGLSSLHAEGARKFLNSYLKLTILLLQKIMFLAPTPKYEVHAPPSPSGTSGTPGPHHIWHNMVNGKCSGSVSGDYPLSLSRQLWNRC